MGSVLVYQRVKEESGFYMHANIQKTMKATGHILLPLFLHIMQLRLLSYCKAHSFIMCKKKQWKQEQKGFYIKAMQVIGLVKKVLKQDD